MTLRPDDPRLTAYALGELEPSEIAMLVSELEQSPEARAELDAIRQTARLLEDELRDTPVSGLGSEHRGRIEHALREPAPAPENVVPLKPRRRRTWIFATAAALPLLLAVGALSLRSGSRTNEKASATSSLEDREIGVLGLVGKDKAAAAPTVMASAASPTLIPELPSQDRQKDVDLPHDTEKYDSVQDNPFVRVDVDPRSTFSVDVDTASYSLVRRFLTSQQRPPKGAVRIEEMINYFSYQYPEPSDGALFTVSTEVSEAPWATEHRLVRIGLKGKNIDMGQRPASNLVFLVDVSGSMSDANKLPLLKQAFRMLVNQLDERDHVSMVVYAGASGTVLPPTPGDRKSEILAALDRLEAGGSTNGAQGIELAYQTAMQHFQKGGVNRVLLATDGDFNVGVTNQSDLVDLIQEKAKGGVFLSVLGFGGGNYADSTLEKLADKGNGNYAYIDNQKEAEKVLVKQATGTLVTIAKDVKIQLEFNPREVAAFRLIGYENRMLAHADFNDDKKDAGEIGAGHTVTALYEIVPAGSAVPGGEVDGLKYQKPTAPTPSAQSGELLTVKLRYKDPDGDKSRLLEVPVRDSDTRLSAASADFRFAAAVASFGMILRDSPHKGTSTYTTARQLAEGGLGNGPDLDERRELVQLINRAQNLAQ
jgi:Ca-activated chloride channel family protein